MISKLSTVLPADLKQITCHQLIYFTFNDLPVL